MADRSDLGTAPDREVAKHGSCCHSDRPCHHRSMNIWELTDLWTPWSAHVAVTLRVAENIAAGTTEIAALAEACGADRDALLRILRQLVSKGVFEEPAPGQFGLNDAARQLIDFRLGLDLEGLGGRMAHSWSTLLTAV